MPAERSRRTDRQTQTKLDKYMINTMSYDFILCRPSFSFSCPFCINYCIHINIIGLISSSYYRLFLHSFAPNKMLRMIVTRRRSPLVRQLFWRRRSWRTILCRERMPSPLSPTQLVSLINEDLRRIYKRMCGEVLENIKFLEHMRCGSQK